MSRVWRSLAGGLLLAIVVLATLALMISGQLRLTIFASDWYQQAFSQDAYIDGLHAGIEADLAEQSAYVGVPAEVLNQGVKDEQVYIMLRFHFQNLADFLNRRAAFSLPTYSAAAFREPLQAYAGEQSQKGGLALNIEQERLLDEIARDSAAIVQRRVALIDLTTVQNSSAFQLVNNLLYFAAQLPILSGLVLLLALILLLLLQRPFRRFLAWAMVGIWIASASIAVPLAVQEWFGLVRRLSVQPDYLKFALDRLLTSATRGLLAWSTVGAIIASVTLVALFLLEEQLADREARRQNKLARRRRRLSPPAGSLAAGD